MNLAVGARAQGSRREAQGARAQGAGNIAQGKIKRRWKRWKIENIRLVTQVFGLILGNGMLLGLPLFGTSNILRHIYFPNASTKFFINAPTYALQYKIQDTLFSGWNSMYIDVLLPILIFLVLTIPLGRVWCAWLCPLGLPQDLLTRLRRRLGIRHLEIAPHHSDFIHSLKYLGVFVIVFYTFALGAPAFNLKAMWNALPVPYEQFDPNRAMYVYTQMAVGLAPASTYVPTMSVLITILFLGTCFAARRFWCHICPQGALMAPLNYIAFVKLRKDPAKCTHCRICYRVCPMEITKVHEERKTREVTSSKCVHCYRCVDNCPEEGCLSVEFLGKKLFSSKYRCQCEEGGSSI